MNRGSFWENPREDRKKLEKKSKTFKTISQYFSKKEWARLGYSEKTTYVNMKRNYETMTRLGLQCTPPAFMCPKNGATKSKRCDSKTKNPREKDEPPQGTSNMQGGKCQKVMPKKPVKGKKRSKIVPGTSGPEQAQRQLRSQAKASISAQQSKKTAGFCHQTAERKPVAYEEISDPEEESNGNTVDVGQQTAEPVAQEEISDHEEESNRNTVNVWANRLRKRKPVAYEEISDPEEEEDEDD
uniref:KRAB-related domain-containing protein n=1 Tax=Bos mutus grunniens TaxID=30521 RepID=A0A8B9XUI5_BOSMU